MCSPFAPLLRSSLLWLSVGGPLVLTSACGGVGAADGGADLALPAGDLAGADLAAAAVDASSGGGGVGCQGVTAALCEDFETGAAGAAPPAARWTVATPNCSGIGTVAVDDAVAHSGGKSLRVSGKGGYCNHIFIANSSAVRAVGKVVYGRFYLRLGATLGDGHVTFMALQDGADNNRDVRMGGQSQILMWNRESDDATLPVLSPAGIALSQKPAPLAWRCVEFLIDGNQGLLQTWVDGAAVSGLQVDSKSTPDVDEQWLRRGAWRPSLQDLRLGWESYAGMDMTLWFDDVVLASQRIGC